MRFTVATLVAALLPTLALGHLEYFCASSVFSNHSQFCNKAVIWLGTCEWQRCLASSALFRPGPATTCALLSIVCDLRTSMHGGSDSRGVPGLASFHSLAVD
jgi:hypothetical protein